MRTQAIGRLPLPALRTLLRTPFSILDGLTTAGARFTYEAAAVFAAIHALPSLVAALERLGPAADSLTKLAETTENLENLARDTQHLPHVFGQLHALHEQVVAIACDLRALEPDVEHLSASAASLDQSIQGLTRMFRPWHEGTRNNQRLPESKR
jgi:hypothetical protein